MASATPAVQHILDNIELCDSFFMAQQGVIDAASMAQSQQSLCMSVQLQLNSIPLMSPLDATAVTTRVQSSMFPDEQKQRLAAVISSRVGTLVEPAWACGAGLRCGLVSPGTGPRENERPALDLGFGKGSAENLT